MKPQKTPNLKKITSIAKRKAKKPIIGRTNKSTIQGFREVEANRLRTIANNPKSKNKEIAQKLLSILRASQKGELVAEEMHLGADHLTLNRIMVKINAFEIQKRKVELTLLERKVFEKYARYV